MPGAAIFMPRRGAAATPVSAQRDLHTRRSLLLRALATAAARRSGRIRVAGKGGSGRPAPSAATKPSGRRKTPRSPLAASPPKAPRRQGNARPRPAPSSSAASSSSVLRGGPLSVPLRGGAHFPFDGRIQLPRGVFEDVAAELMMRRRRGGLGHAPRLLVFGLGYDTPVWQHVARAAGGRVVFTEQNKRFVDMNPSAAVLYIPDTAWRTGTDFGIDMAPAESLMRPPLERMAQLLELRGTGEAGAAAAATGPLEELRFDAVVVDGPTGVTGGRQTACWWASMLAAEGAPIYVDDVNRPRDMRYMRTYLGAPRFKELRRWKTGRKLTAKLRRVGPG